jgi:hypothetical protein
MLVCPAGITLGRDIGLGIAAFYYRYISLTHPKTFLRFVTFRSVCGSPPHDTEQGPLHRPTLTPSNGRPKSYLH